MTGQYSTINNRFFNNKFAIIVCVFTILASNSSSVFAEEMNLEWTMVTQHQSSQANIFSSCLIKSFTNQDQNLKPQLNESGRDRFLGITDYFNRKHKLSLFNRTNVLNQFALYPRTKQEYTITYFEFPRATTLRPIIRAAEAMNGQFVNKIPDDFQLVQSKRALVYVSYNPFHREHQNDHPEKLREIVTKTGDCLRNIQF